MQESGGVLWDGLEPPSSLQAAWLHSCTRFNQSRSLRTANSYRRWSSLFGMPVLNFGVVTRNECGGTETGRNIRNSHYSVAVFFGRTEWETKIQVKFDDLASVDFWIFNCSGQTLHAA